MRHYEYTDSTSVESLLHSINPCLTNLREQLISRSINETSTQYHPDLEDVPARWTYVSTERHTQVTSERLADRFCIGPERAKATFRATTQRGVRSAILPIGRRYRADRIFDVRRLNGKFATVTLTLPHKSILIKVDLMFHIISQGRTANRSDTRYPILLTTTAHRNT
jgi:hypothetical protein